MTCFICNDAIVQPNNSSFIRQTPLIMLIVCVCPHSFNAKDIRKEEGERNARARRPEEKLLPWLMLLQLLTLWGEKQ